MTSRELIYITLEMLDAHAVIGSIVPTLEKAPERFYPIGVRLIADVFSNRVFYRLVLKIYLKAIITAVIVGIDG